jgi:hypothetical protein
MTETRTLRLRPGTTSVAIVEVRLASCVAFPFRSVRGYSVPIIFTSVSHILFFSLLLLPLSFLLSSRFWLIYHYNLNLLLSTTLKALRRPTAVQSALYHLNDAFRKGWVLDTFT